MYVCMYVCIGSKYVSNKANLMRTRILNSEGNKKVLEEAITCFRSTFFKCESKHRNEMLSNLIFMSNSHIAKNKNAVF